MPLAHTDLQEIQEHVKLYVLQQLDQQIAEQVERKLAAAKPPGAIGLDISTELLERMVRVEEGLKTLGEQMDKRFEQMNLRFAEQREDTNRRFTEQRGDTNRRFAEQREYMDRRFAEQREDITKNGKRITFFSTAIIAFVTASLVLLGIVLSRIGT